MAETDGVVDVTILGAGPAGLSAAYYVGHRDGTVRIVESLEQIGGQVAATYPEKHVYDVAGFPKILGQKLVDMCAEQGLQGGFAINNPNAVSSCGCGHSFQVDDASPGETHAHAHAHAHGGGYGSGCGS